MIAFLGDIHGEFGRLELLARAAASAGAEAVIQVGDFGFGYNRELLARIDLPIPVYAIDGNHEIHALLGPYERMGAGMPQQIRHNLSYVPRGGVLEFAGLRIGCLGGAGSIDKDLRLKYGGHWSGLEQITVANVAMAMTMGPIDIMVTHTPPQSFITKYFETPERKKYKVEMFGVPLDWSDPSAAIVQQIWEHHGKPRLYCGHMHESITDTEMGIQCLDIGELVYFSSREQANG